MFGFVPPHSFSSVGAMQYAHTFLWCVCVLMPDAWIYNPFIQTNQPVSQTSWNPLLLLVHPLKHGTIRKSVNQIRFFSLAENILLKHFGMHS